MAKKLSKIDIVKRILESRQNRKVSWENKDGEKFSDTLDYFSAQAILAVYNAMNEANREKMMAASWPRIVNFCHKHTSFKIT